jgi:hypothetical protein
MRKSMMLVALGAALGMAGAGRRGWNKPTVARRMSITG